VEWSGLKFNFVFLWACVSVLGLAGCSGGDSSPAPVPVSGGDAFTNPVPVESVSSCKTSENGGLIEFNPNLSLVSLGANCEFASSQMIDISGTIEFERIPLATDGSLDFSAETTQPARQVVVEALCNGGVDMVCSGVQQTVQCNGALALTSTDTQGQYSLQVPANTANVTLRARAQMNKTGNPAWNVRVVDESQSTNPVFALDSAPFDVGTLAIGKSLLATSGSDGTSYTSARIAAPFAILDTVYKSMQLVLGTEPNTVFPSLTLKWSETNSAGSFYTNQTISLFGYQLDTDEYDEHVIAHEWGHYFQDAFSCDDSIGGPHSGGDILDIRVAFSEGFGNAFSAMVLDDSLYRDSQGLDAGFSIDVENNNCNIYSNDDVNGWYNECSVQSVLYDFYDINSDSNDAFNLGFDEIHQVLVDEMPKGSAFTSLFSFINAFKSLPDINGSAADSLLAAQSITASISDDYGTTATAAGGSSIPLPPYLDGTDVFLDGAQVCSTRVHGGYNGLGVSRYVRFTVPSTKTYTFKAERLSGLSSADPDMYLYYKGQLLAVAESWDTNSESFSVYLETDKEYILELREYNYTDPDLAPTPPTATTETCFMVTRS
jgi:hypothetical protein